MATSDDVPSESRSRHSDALMPEPEWSDPLGVLPVLRLTTPALPGRVVISRATARDSIVLLAYGDVNDRSGPFVGVTTQSQFGRSLIADVENALWYSLVAPGATRWQRPPVGTRRELTGSSSQQLANDRLRIEDAHVSCRIHREGDVWTARARVPVHVLTPGPGFPGTQITIIVRGLEVHEVRLAGETDLSRYPRDALDGLVPETPRSDYQAIERLIRTVVDRDGRPEADAAEVINTDAFSTVGQQWDAAHRAHIHYSKGSSDDSAAALLALVAQLGMLAGKVTWWSSAGRKATAETIRHSVFNSPVPSLSAQQLWSGVATDAHRRADWLQAWQEWFVMHSEQP